MIGDSSICIKTTEFYAYAFILFVIVGYLIFLIRASAAEERLSNVDLTSHLNYEDLKAKINELADKLYNSQLAEQQCQSKLFQLSEKVNDASRTTINVGNRMYNPLEYPSRIYKGTNTRNNEMLGYVYKGDARYPLFGRYKYPGRTEKWDYYIVDENRNRLKIPFKSVNDNELTSQDTVNIPTLGDDFHVTIYDYDDFKYDPDRL